MSDGEAEIKTRVVYVRGRDDKVAARAENGCLVLQSRYDRKADYTYTLYDVCHWIIRTMPQKTAVATLKRLLDEAASAESKNE